MFINQALTATIAALSFVTGTFAAPTSLPVDPNPGVLSEPIPFDPSKYSFLPPHNETSVVSNIQKRAECSSVGILNTADVEIMRDRLWGMTETSLSMPRQTYREYTQNSVKACLYNNYWFEDGDITPGEWGWGVSMVRSDCCFTDFCAGGYQTVHGLNGLSMYAQIYPAGQKC